MRITIDANTDTLTVDDTGGLLGIWKVQHAHHQREILSEIFNRLNIAGVTLEYIDEDKRQTEEW